ncbi:MAG: efflux RND transporter periplasmic adaptor subunit [Gammaproteobacteria bacterium]
MMRQTLFTLLIGLFSATLLADSNLTSAEPSYRRVTVTGFSRARNSMSLSTEIAGKVVQVFTDVGQPVPDHGKVACLDDTFVNIAIAEEKNAIAQNLVDVRYFEKQVARYRELVNKNSAAISQLDEVSRNLENAQRQAEAARLRHRYQQEKLKRLCVHAPPGWLVTARASEPGQWLDVGAHVASVGNYMKLLVPLSLSVEELSALWQIQSNLTVRLPDYDRTVPASIERISPEFDEKSRKTLVDLLVEKDLPVHRGGIRAELVLNLPDPSDHFLIDENALDKRFEEVWLERNDGSRMRIDVLTSNGNGQVRIRSSQIKAGDQFKLMRP